jgi:hypothetical protein
VGIMKSFFDMIIDFYKSVCRNCEVCEGIVFI